MDANGARELKHRIEQHRHWQQAGAVRNGQQPARDPDAARLTAIEGGVRLYESERVRELIDGRGVTIVRTVAKQLVDGWWTATTVEGVETA